MITILDCYTDEPAGLGVPPYLGTYPRYIAGSLKDMPYYLTVDDLRLCVKHGSIAPKEVKKSMKTDISVYNLTKNFSNAKKILGSSDEIIIVLGVHTPGKYLSAIPGTLGEVERLLKALKTKAKITLTGPAVYGTQLHGGKQIEKTTDFFDEVKDYDFSYSEIASYAIRGAGILSQIPDIRVIELETGKGCSRKTGCSFCTEPLKNKTEYRDAKDILSEALAFSKIGARHFRLGKQSCYYSHPKAAEMVKAISDSCSPSTLHIDNVNPVNVIADKDNRITKAIVTYCTPGNVAAFGAETFDKEVAKKNNLNCTPELVFKAAKIINQYGSARGENGMPRFLPGINLILGLIGETKGTLEENYLALKQMLDENILLRRINIRQVVPFPGTKLFEEAGTKFISKNKKHYFSFRKKIREEIDFQMLKKILPEGTMLKDVRMEIYDGNHTFGRQIGTYPLIVGVDGRLQTGKYYDLKVKKHMLRSIVCELP